MANTILLKDKTLILTDERIDFENMLRDAYGDDAARAFSDWVDADGYLEGLRKIKEVLRCMESMVNDENRLNCKRLKAAVYDAAAIIDGLI